MGVGPCKSVGALFRSFRLISTAMDAPGLELALSRALDDVLRDRHRDLARLLLDAADRVARAIQVDSALVYDQFEREVRREYWFVSRRRFAAARVGILRGILARPRIFHFEPFRERYETRARENLARAIEALQG